MGKLGLGKLGRDNSTIILDLDRPSFPPPHKNADRVYVTRLYLICLSLRC